MVLKRKSQILQPSFFWLFFILYSLPAHAKNVDFSNFSASCPQMRSSLAVTERKINALRLSDKKFLRIQLAEYQALSRIKTSGTPCKKIKRFFEQQASNTRNALRNRASSSSARARKTQAQLNAFVSDMETLQVVLGGIESVITSTGSSTELASGSRGVASKGPKETAASHCIKLETLPATNWRPQEYRLTNICSYAIWYMHCEPTKTHMSRGCPKETMISLYRKGHLGTRASQGVLRPKRKFTVLGPKIEYYAIRAWEY